MKNRIRRLRKGEEGRRTEQKDGLLICLDNIVIFIIRQNTIVNRKHFIDRGWTSVREDARIKSNILQLHHDP